MTLYIGDDWASDHHDIEIQNETGEPKVIERIPEGPTGITRLYELIAAAAGSSNPDPHEVILVIETSQGNWFQTLVAAGFQVYPVNPFSVSRYRERYAPAGKKSDKFDAHVLANIARLDHGSHRAAHEDSDDARALKALTRPHQKMVWDRTRESNRLKDQLRQYFPGAITAYDTLGICSPDALKLLMAAPTPEAAAALTDEQFTAELKTARRRKISRHIDQLRQALAEPALPDASPVIDARAIAVVATCRILLALNESITELEDEMTIVFRRHPDSDIYVSMPGIAELSGARLLAEYGDDPERFASSAGRRNYSGMAPVTASSGKRRTVKRRKARNRFLASTTRQWAFNSLAASPDCKRYYDELIARGVKHETALRNVGGHLTKCLDACLKNGELYDPVKAWPLYHQQAKLASRTAA